MVSFSSHSLNYNIGSLTGLALMAFSLTCMWFDACKAPGTLSRYHSFASLDRGVPLFKTGMTGELLSLPHICLFTTIEDSPFGLLKSWCQAFTALLGSSELFDFTLGMRTHWVACVSHRPSGPPAPAP